MPTASIRVCLDLALGTVDLEAAGVWVDLEADLLLLTLEHLDACAAPVWRQVAQNVVFVRDVHPFSQTIYLERDADGALRKGHLA